MKSVSRQFVPNAGTVLIIGLLLLVQGAGAQQSTESPLPDAAVRHLISYQGVLASPDGTPIDEAVTMEFALYDDAAGGTLLWGKETHEADVREGHFRVLLGGISPIDPRLISGELYLEIQVNDERLIPRERIVSSVVNSVAASGDGASYVEGDLQVGSNAWVPGFADMDGQDLAVYGQIEQFGSEGTRVAKLGIGIDPGADEGTLEMGGTINMNGYTIANCGALTEANLLSAQELAAGRSERFEEGDLLCWSAAGLEKCTTENDQLVQAVADTEGRPIIIGAERMKVLGPVKLGDILVASGVPGYAMVNNDPPSGSVIGQALADFDGEAGLVKAMIRKW
jgi:hypothetical protein